MHLRILLSLLAFYAWLVPSFVRAEGGLPIVDDFSKPNILVRIAGRGDWKFAEGMIRCTQDDELYKKYKDHGPIITYKVPFRDAAISYSVKPDAKVKNVVFTINAEKGHVFRIVASAQSSRALVFDRETHQGRPLATDLPVLRAGEWNEASVAVRGKEITLKIGDWSKSFHNEEVDIEKANVTIGFAFGTLAVRQVKIEP